MTAGEKNRGKLEGKIALVTGATSGIGLATAKSFVAEGAYVFITGRREKELASAVENIGENVTGVQGDVSNLGHLDRLFEQIRREKGKLDIVFANAGIARFAESRCAFVRPDLDNGFEGSSHSSERNKPWRHRDLRIE
jgi:NAD(P)-dependent dehydrogenase (short-subunit alcohol dehydrogenase family)